MFYQSPSHLFKLVFGSLWLLVAATSGQPVFAQLPAAGGFRVVSHKPLTKSGTDFMLEQQVLGADGTVMRPVTAIPRGFVLEAAAQSGARNLYLLRKIRGDSVMLLLTDSVGRTLQRPRQCLPRMGGAARQLAPAHLFGLPAGKGFVFTYPSGKSGRPELQVQALSPALAVLWQREYQPNCLTSVERIAASDTHLWLVLREYLALALRPRVLNFLLTTGEVECNQSLAPKDELDAVAAVPAGLLILGTSDRQTSYVAAVEPGKTPGTRRDFALLLSPTGQRAFGVGLGWPLPGRPSHYRWQSAYPLPAGGYQLIGETYRNAPNADVIARGVLGAGMIGIGLGGFAGTGSMGTTGSFIVPLGGYINEQPWAWWWRS